MKKLLISSILLTGLAFADGLTTWDKCKGCHGVLGDSKALGKETILQGVSAADMEKTLLAYRDGSLNKFGMGVVMKGQIAALSLEEVKELSVYIATLKAEK